MRFPLCFMLLTSESKHKIASKRIKGDTMKRKSFLLCTVSLATLLAGTLAPVAVLAEDSASSTTTVQAPSTTEMSTTSTTISNSTSQENLTTEAPVSTVTSTTSLSEEPTLTAQAESFGVVYPIYRLYNPRNGEHLYTPDANEKTVLYERHGWGYEGVAWYAQSSGKPVYRLYNAGLQNHLYTTDTNEVHVLTTRHGWQSDNQGRPVFYSYGNVDIYRVYNPKLRGLHHWTTDKNEYNVLPKHGWRQEGIKFQGFKIGVPIRTQYVNQAKPVPKVVTQKPKTTTKPATQKPKTTTKVASKPVTKATTKVATKPVTKAATKPTTKATTATTKPSTSVTTKATTARPTTTTPTTTTVTTTTTKPTTADNSAYLIATVPKIMSQILDAYRAEQGEPAARYDAKNLQALADLRARQIQEEYAHSYKGKSVADIAYETIEDEDLALMLGATGISENIVRFSAKDMTADDVANQMMKMWKESHGHNMNLLASDLTNYAFAISKVGNTYYGVFLGFNENFG